MMSARMLPVRLLAAFMLGALLLPPAPRPADVIVVIDTDSPALAPDDATRLRTALLDGLDPATTRYARLSREGLAVVSDDEAPRLIGTTYLASPPPEVTFTEAVEILRGNQAVRDDLLARRCRAPAAPGCGARIAALVEAVVRGTERATATKVRALADLARANPRARVIVVASGWPTRDDGRAGVEAAVRTLRASDVALVVVRTPGGLPFQGLVRDAAERLAAHLRADFALVADDADVADARSRVVPGTDVSTPAAASTAAAPDATEPDTTVATSIAAGPDPPHAAAPQPAASTTPIARAGATDETLRRASAYVARFERTFAAMRWHERYEQVVRVERRYGASGARTTTVADTRVLEAEMMLVRLPAERTWLTVRDVISVDGRLRATGERRLPALSATSPLSIPTLRALARENSRFDIGTIVRTFSEPTLALLFLDDDHRQGVAFARRDESRQAGRRVVRYDLDEQARPTVVTANGRDVPAQGYLRIDADSGEVVETAMVLTDPVAGLLGRMTVTYGPSARFDVLVPEAMRESYASKTGETVETEALYSNFRRFETAGRLVPE